MAGGQSVTTAGGAQSQQQPAQQGQGQMASGQQQQMKAQLKAMKLAPSSKPQGIDPTVIIKEREHRYVLVIYCAGVWWSWQYISVRDT